VGAVLALTGAGGGALAVPLLVLVLGWSIHLAAPVALVAVGLSAWLGAAFALREGIVRYRAAMVLGAPAWRPRPGRGAGPAPAAGRAAAGLRAVHALHRPPHVA
jgi:uncharacterized membrane protein YfcA